MLVGPLFAGQGWRLTMMAPPDSMLLVTITDDGEVPMIRTHVTTAVFEDATFYKILYGGSAIFVRKANVLSLLGQTVPMVGK
jgi:hypothetical protein